MNDPIEWTSDLLRGFNVMRRATNRMRAQTKVSVSRVDPDSEEPFIFRKNAPLSPREIRIARGVGAVA